MRRVLQIVERNKAGQGIRFLNYAIDNLVIYVFFFVLGIVAVLMDEYLDISFLLSIVDTMSEVNRFEDMLITSFIYFLYVFLMEYFTNGRTIGKYITGTTTLMINGSLPNSKSYLIRTLVRSIPLEAFSFLGNNGWHDSWSDTRVVRIKDYEAALKLEKEMEMLGSTENF